MNVSQIVAPNLNGVMYRNHIPDKNVINTYFDFLDISKDGNMLLGSTNLNGRIWNGSICYFKDSSSKFALENRNAAVNLDTGVTSGKFFSNDKKIIVSHDSGDLNILNITDSELKVVAKYNNQQHDDRITDMSLWKNTTQFVTGCADASIRTWDITESCIVSTQDYKNAHFNIVSSVNADSKDINMFASCSYDRTAVVWDKRTEDSEKVIYENECCSLTSIEWHPTNTHNLLATTSAGDMYLLDTREPDKVVTKASSFQRSIHKTCFGKNGLLAVCADDCQVRVYDIVNEDFKLLYTDDRHIDFVRGLAWHDDTLISCGWDSNVFKHHP